MWVGSIESVREILLLTVNAWINQCINIVPLKSALIAFTKNKSANVDFNL